MRRWTTCDIFIASNTSDRNGSAEMAKDVVVKTSIDEKGVQEFTEMFLASGVEPRSIEPRECTLEEFGCHFFAEVEGKIVGRVFLDTLYPPYAELVNLLVHPDYRKKGVGSALVQACIDLAQKRSCSLIHLFAEYDNQIAMKLYSKFGFMPIIDADLRVERGEFVHYMHFSSETRLGDFLRIHPHASQHVYPEKVEFHGRSLFKCEWSDFNSGDRTAIFVNAKRGQPIDAFMPRIAGASHTLRNRLHSTRRGFGTGRRWSQLRTLGGERRCYAKFQLESRSGFSRSRVDVLYRLGHFQSEPDGVEGSAPIVRRFRA